MASSAPEYTLYYWPGLPGRGEFVRLLFEYTATPFRQALEPKALVPHLHATALTGAPPHFAVPLLEIASAPPAENAAHKARKTAGGQSAHGAAHASVFLSQTPNILQYLGARLGLVGDVKGEDEAVRDVRRAHVNQLVLTALDLACEAHNTHHPVSVNLYYEDQKAESLVAAKHFRNARVPKYLKYFALALSSNPTKSGWLIGDSVTTADLALFCTISGVQHAFPKYMAALEAAGKYPELFKHKEALADEPTIAAYLVSDRRIPHSLHGIFRHYEELDGELEEE